MSTRGKPSRKSIEARLKSLARELRRIPVKVNLPARLPSDETGIDRLAAKLLSLHKRHKSKAAFELVFEVAGPMVADMVLAYLQKTFTDTPPEDVVAQVFLELSRPEVEPPAADGKSFRRRVTVLLPEVAGAADHRKTVVERRLAAPLRKIAGGASNSPARPAGDVNKIIAQNFLTLPELTQRCFYLHLVEGKSLADVARELGLSLASVGRKMKEGRSRALAMLDDSRETGESERPGSPPDRPWDGSKNGDDDAQEDPFEGGQP